MPSAFTANHSPVLNGWAKPPIFFTALNISLSGEIHWKEPTLFLSGSWLTFSTFRSEVRNTVRTS